MSFWKVLVLVWGIPGIPLTTRHALAFTVWVRFVSLSPKDWDWNLETEDQEVTCQILTAALNMGLSSFGWRMEHVHKDSLRKSTSIVAYFSKKRNFAIGRSEVTAASGSLNVQHSKKRNHLAQDFLRLDINWRAVKVIMDVPDREPTPLEDEKQRLLALKALGPQGHRYWSDKVLTAEASGHTDHGPLDSLNSKLPIRGPSCSQHPWEDRKLSWTAMPRWNITETTENMSGTLSNEEPRAEIDTER